MKKRLVVLAAVLALALSSLAWAASRFDRASVTADDSAAGNVLAFDDASGTFNARSVCVKNDAAANSVYISLKQADATTSDTEVKPADPWICWKFDPNAGGDGWAQVNYICSAGQTAAIRIEAMR